MLRKFLLMAVCCLWASPGSAEMVNLKSAFGSEFKAYVVGSEAARVGIVFAHDRWGLGQEAKNWADRLAEQGYRVVVADLYDERAVRDELMTQEVMAQTDPEWVHANLNGALSYLKKRQQKVAVLGWGYGAVHLYQIASQRVTDIDALVAFYALPSGEQLDLEGIDLPMLGVFGKQDRILSVARVDDFQRLMLRLRKSFEVVTVDADTGFVNPRNPTYQLAASDAAWETTQAFLKRHLVDE